MRKRSLAVTLVAATLVLVTTAWQRGAEYDEQYSLFLTAGLARPIWTEDVINAGAVRALQDGHATLFGIARHLRATDVHPPLYFWTLAAWRWVTGPSLFTARMLSVLLSIVTLALVAAIARMAAIPAVPAVLLTLGCYGFTYTGTLTRGFALAQMLNLAGFAAVLLAERRPGRSLAFGVGLCFGAASFTNYLAAFEACAMLCARANRRWYAVIGFMLWLPAGAWFFLAQRRSRTGQFLPFDVVSASTRLARYLAADVFGGLPLYVPSTAQPVVMILLSVFLVGLAVIVISRWRWIVTFELRLIAACAVAPPLGLMLLGLAFNNTPIELRYLAFVTPFLGLLLAAALPTPVRYLTLTVQALALAGLMLRPETMQPARATARAAVALVQDGVVLLPHGNDGVGIVGAFANEAPTELPLLVIDRNQTPSQIRQRADGFHRVVLATIEQDDASRATVPIMRQAFATPCWRAAAEAYNVLVYEQICGE